MDTIIIASIIGAVATILGALVSAYANMQKPKLPKVKEKANYDSAELELALSHRINDAKKNLRSYNIKLLNHRWSSFLLVFGQYVVGGVLATSFIYKSIPKEIIGTLGLLVMIASFFRNKDRPDTKILMIKEKSLRNLRAAIRKAEDEFSMAKSSKNSEITTEQMLKTLNDLTFALNAIEEEEFYQIIESEK